ncbi:hypothetical protein QCA50_016864 [Cerrena zonata]|uniref:LAA1-like C-terminal TPR repeats domain-containing protein n=1 Tax=Cerrena zonata TaxID=2478898 RepID=A0AAW0FEM6_9APHY
MALSMISKASISDHISKHIKEIVNDIDPYKRDSEEDESTEPELKETLEKYSTLLTSLWILVLRELSSLKYNENSTRELELYDDYWINFVSVLSLQLEKDDEFIKTYLAEDEKSPELAPRGIQCIKSLIQYSSLQSDDILVVKKLIKEIIKSLVANKNEHKIDIKVSFEILFMFSKLENHDESKSTLLFSILIPLLLSYNKAENGNDPALDKAYLNEKLLNLINQNPAAFKTVLNSALSDEQKQLTEQLVKFNPNTVETPDVVEGESEIQLKTFGV